jgi:hypothetical protein
MPWSVVAASAYRALCAALSTKTPGDLGRLGDLLIITQGANGGRLPLYEELTPAAQTCWEAAIRQAGECMRVGLGSTPPDERHWARFVAPQFKDDMSNNPPPPPVAPEPAPNLGAKAELKKGERSPNVDRYRSAEVPPSPNVPTPKLPEVKFPGEPKPE